MSIHNYQTIKFELGAAVCRIFLARPEVHNAFNALMIRELHDAFASISDIARNEPLAARVVVLSGEGKSFSAGADVNWMRESLAYSREQNRADAAKMAAMFKQINSCPVPVVARIHGAALGGGSGLAATSDIVIAEERTTFAFSEVRLGIAPAVISPFVVAKIGSTHARALFMTGERFGVERALAIGLVHLSAPQSGLDDAVQKVVSDVLSSAPQSITRAKSLIAQLSSLPPDEATQLTVDTIAALRTAPEGQEGLSAFLDKRKPGWKT